MKNSTTKLLREQLDQKFIQLQALSEIGVPPSGWVYAVRTSLKMSLKQLGNKLGITPQSTKELETREKNGSITLRALNDAADCLNLKLVYALIPKDGSLQSLVERAAYAAAEKIVMRASISMKLENQENSDERLQKAIKDKADKIIREMPGYLWD